MPGVGVSVSHHAPVQVVGQRRVLARPRDEKRAQVLLQRGGGTHAHQNQNASVQHSHNHDRSEETKTIRITGAVSKKA